MKEEQGVEHVSKSTKITPSRPQSTEFVPTTLILLLAQMQNVAVLLSPFLCAEAVDLRNQWDKERVSIKPQNGENTKKFVCINFNYA